MVLAASSGEDDSIHVAKKQAAADLASKMQEKQKKKEADEKEAESKVTKSEEKEKTRPSCGFCLGWGDSEN